MAKKVLVCDDEPYILESVSYVVQQEGYVALAAENGEEALRLARTEMPDVMILDIWMPGKDGNTVCRELKSNPTTRRVYIIMLTAKGQERDMEESLQCGADEYMTKPFSPRSLRKKLHELLD